MTRPVDVILTGHMRTFSQCVHTLRWQVLRHFKVEAFYVSTVKDADTHSVAWLSELFPGVPMHTDVVDAQPELQEPEEPVRFEPYARSVPIQAVLRQLWQLERGWRLRQEKKGTAPLVIRTRPDLFFHSFSSPLLAHSRLANLTCETPYWGRFGGVNDRFALMTDDASEAYFTTFSKIGRLLEAGCPLHPESLVKASLEDGEITIKDTLQTEFSTIRKNGEIREPELSPADFCHCALHGLDVG